MLKCGVLLIFAVCGGRLTAKSVIQHIYSHTKYGDANYGNGAECDWLIEAEGSQGFVHLQFVAFELEGKEEKPVPSASVCRCATICIHWVRVRIGIGAVCSIGFEFYECSQCEMIPRY